MINDEQILEVDQTSANKQQQQQKSKGNKPQPKVVAKNVPFDFYKNICTKYMPNNDTKFTDDDIIEDMTQVFDAFDNELLHYFTKADYTFLKLRDMAPYVSVSSSSVFGGSELFTGYKNVRAVPNAMFDLTCLAGQVRTMSSTIENLRDIEYHPLLSLDELEGNTGEHRYRKVQSLIDAEEIYNRNDNISKLPSTFGRRENDFYSSWYVLLTGLQRLDQSNMLPFTKLFLYAQQYLDLSTSQTAGSKVLNDRVTGSLNTTNTSCYGATVSNSILPFNENYRFPANVLPPEFRVDAQVVPLGWFCSAQTDYNGQTFLGDTPADRYIKGKAGVRVIPIIGGKIPIMYVMCHLYYPWMVWTAQQLNKYYRVNAGNGIPGSEEHVMRIVSNAAIVELGQIYGFDREDINHADVTVLESILFVDVTDKNTVVNRSTIDFDVLSYQVPELNEEPLDLLPAILDTRTRWIGSWRNALEYMTRVYRSTRDMCDGFKQALWLSTRYNRAGSTSTFNDGGKLCPQTFTESITRKLVAENDSQLACSAFHQLGDGTYIQITNTSDEWSARQVDYFQGTVLDSSDRFKLAVASGALVDNADYDINNCLVQMVVSLSGLDSNLNNLIYTMKDRLHLLHWLQSRLFSISGLSLSSVSRNDRYASSGYDELRTPLVKWAMKWDLSDESDSRVSIEKVITSRNNTLFGIYPSIVLVWNTLLPVDKGILLKFGGAFPRVAVDGKDLVNSLNLKTYGNAQLGVSAFLTDKMHDFDYMKVIDKYFGFRIQFVSAAKNDNDPTLLHQWNYQYCADMNMYYNAPMLYRSQNYGNVDSTNFEAIITFLGRCDDEIAGRIFASYAPGDQTRRVAMPFTILDSCYPYDKWESDVDMRAEIFMTLNSTISEGLDLNYVTTNGNLDVSLPLNDVRSGKLSSIANKFRDKMRKASSSKFSNE